MSVRPDGTRLPPAALPLTMDDETQYRCAGFVQAEIEQFVDELDEGAGGEKGTTTEDESSHPGSASEEEEDARKKGKKAKKAKAKRILREDSPGTSVHLRRSRLQL
jgi:cohesin complex subunit SA-1/2